MRPSRFFIVIILLSLMLAVISCTPKKQQPSETSGRSGTDWPQSSPEAQGIDSTQLAAMMEEIGKQKLRIHSVQIVRNGVMVLDAYFPPFEEGERHEIYSCTKSIISLLIGIALDEGYIESLDQKVTGFFPGRKFDNPSEDKDRLTVRHLLTMSTGLDSRDSYLYGWEGLRRLQSSDDWIGHILDLPIASQPGSRFDYSNMASCLLSIIITETTGKTALAFAQEKLFGPLGITDIHWPSERQGQAEYSIGWSEIQLKPPDLAKIGQLMLNDGMWEGQRLLSSDYLRAATSPQIRAEQQQNDYGYQWWILEPGLFTALGYRGQYLLVYPEKNLVAVFTSDVTLSNTGQPYTLFRTYIRPAVLSEKAIPENKEALKTLNKLLK